VLFFEFGSDAFNAREFTEDQISQAMILRDQWKEMYNKAAGNGEEGNSVGGFVFEWRDEWWKYLQTENLDKQDTNASWSNQGYMFDWAEGKNNMNEEWFGITALGMPNSEQPMMSCLRFGIWIRISSRRVLTTRLSIISIWTTTLLKAKSGN
jgi:hypothetical protein